MNALEVLMIDDNEDDVLLVRMAMEKAGLGHHLTALEDGADAIRYFQHLKQAARTLWPDVILLDLKLPGKNGAEVLDEIRSDPALRAIPVVVLSSSRLELASAKARGLSGEMYRVKPSLFEGYVELVNAIEAARLKAMEDKAQSES